MTPKQKAESLLERMSKQTYKYQPYSGANYLEEEVGYEAGKKCAIICVDEMMQHAQMIETEYEGYSNPYEYLIKVKHEISLL